MGKKIRLAPVLVLVLGLLSTGIALGQAVFYDDFEQDKIGKEPSKWIVLDKLPGDPPGRIIKDPEDTKNKVFLTSIRGDKIGRIYVAPTELKDYAVEWDWMFLKANNIGIVFRYKDRDNHYLFDRRTNNMMDFWKRQGGGWQNFSSKPLVTQLDVWYRGQLIVKGTKFTAKMKERDDEKPFDKIEPIAEGSDANFKDGPFGFYGGEDPEAAIYDNVIIGATVEELFLAVKPALKLTATWGNLKAGY